MKAPTSVPALLAGKRAQVVGIVTAYFLLGEQISVAQLAGGAVLLAGLAVVSGIIIPEKLKAGLVARPRNWLREQDSNLRPIG